MQTRLILFISILILMAGCGGSQGGKKHDRARTPSPADEILKTIGSEQQIRALLTIWRTASLTKVGIDNRFFGPQRNAGEAQLLQLKIIAAQGLQQLDNALRAFKYQPDPIQGKLDTITQPWVTCIKKYGDCDDSAWLCAALMPGTIYDIMEFRGGFKAGHLVFVTPDGHVFSNFELDGRISDPQELGTKYNKHWTHLIKLTKDITVESIIVR
jgi:hypothetical protein